MRVCVYIQGTTHRKRAYSIREIVGGTRATIIITRQILCRERGNGKRRTCRDHLVEAGLFRGADSVTRPAAQRPVIHVGRGGVIELARGALVRVFGGRNVGKVTAAVESPMEGDRGRVGLHLANQTDRLVLQRAVHLLGHVQRWRRRVLIPPSSGRV